MFCENCNKYLRFDEVIIVRSIMDDDQETYKLWRIRKTIMQVRIKLGKTNICRNEFRMSDI